MYVNIHEIVLCPNKTLKLKSKMDGLMRYLVLTFITELVFHCTVRQENPLISP